MQSVITTIQYINNIKIFIVILLLLMNLIIHPISKTTTNNKVNAFLLVSSTISSSSSLSLSSPIQQRQQQRQQHNKILSFSNTKEFLRRSLSSSLSSASSINNDSCKNHNKEVSGIDHSTHRHDHHDRHVNERNSMIDTSSNSSQQNRHQHNQKLGMTIALTSSYCMVMGAKCALPSVLSLLLSPSIGLTYTTTLSKSLVPIQPQPQQMMAQLLMISTISIAFGKVLLGPMIDYYGGKNSLLFALYNLCISLLLLSSSITQSFYIFAIIWIYIDFIFSSCWPACINTIYQYYNTDTDYSIQIGYIAAAARIGNTIAFVLFALIIHLSEHIIKQSWRPVFLVAGCLQLIPITLLSIYGNEKKYQNNSITTTSSSSSVGIPNIEPIKQTKQIKSSIISSFKTLQKEMYKIDFWLHMINRSLLMIYASFLLFVPTLMKQIYYLSSAKSAQVGSYYAIGCLFSVTTLSKYYPIMDQRTKLIYITLLLLFGATGSSLLQLAHVCGYIHLSSLVSSILLFIWGFSFAIPFYIPPSLYALKNGGKESSATITDIFDIGGFGLLALFNGYVASINHTIKSAWIPTFFITTCCAFISYIALFIATLREGDKIETSKVKT